ncbi:hypothetical protein [Evansella tamaricis]|uniref:Uncharacterized protein n=1 Tax=Evansella tamaricis TaxID=2069301 RepID=A0ABS6J9H9_9BACI|nr:hypothetical protein [Evansella tamaricis]MBU9710341.1 hypothetical protein [Evansella tamaricis]
MDEDVKTGNWFKRTIIFGTLACSIYLVSNKRVRTKAVNGVKEFTDQTKNWYTVIKDNREQVLEQIKLSGDKLSRVVEDASEDVQRIVVATQHMKEHSQVLLQTLKETQSEFSQLKDKFKIEKSNRVAPGGLLPERDDEILQ